MPFYLFPKNILLGHFIKHKSSISEEFLELLPTKKIFSEFTNAYVCMYYFLFQSCCCDFVTPYMTSGVQEYNKAHIHKYYIPSENFELLQIFKRRNALWFREGSKHRKTDLAPQVLNFVRFDGKNHHHGQQETGWRSVKENLPQKRVGSNSWRSCVR